MCIHKVEVNQINQAVNVRSQSNIVEVKFSDAFNTKVLNLRNIMNIINREAHERADLIPQIEKTVYPLLFTHRTNRLSTSGYSGSVVVVDDDTVLMIDRKKPQNALILESIDLNWAHRIYISGQRINSFRSTVSDYMKCDKISSKKTNTANLSLDKFKVNDNYDYVFSLVKNVKIKIDGKNYKSGDVIKANNLQRAKITFDPKKEGSLVLMSVNKNTWDYWLESFNGKYTYRANTAWHYSPSKK